LVPERPIPLPPLGDLGTCLRATAGGSPSYTRVELLLQTDSRGQVIEAWTRTKPEPAPVLDACFTAVARRWRLEKTNASKVRLMVYIDPEKRKVGLAGGRCYHAILTADFDRCRQGSGSITLRALFGADGAPVAANLVQSPAEGDRASCYLRRLAELRCTPDPDGAETMAENSFEGASN
jgi:hypothetical protein